MAHTLIKWLIRDQAQRNPTLTRPATKTQREHAASKIRCRSVQTNVHHALKKQQTASLLPSRRLTELDQKFRGCAAAPRKQKIEKENYEKRNCAAFRKDRFTKKKNV